MTDKEIKVLMEGFYGLAGETIALQFVVSGLCIGLAKTGNEQLVRDALAYADHLVEAGSVKFAASLSPTHTQNAMRVVEAIRASALGNHGEPQQDV